MRTFQARAWQEEGWWLVEVPDIGLTQAHDAAEAHFMVKDMIAVMTELDPSEFEVEISGLPATEAPSPRSDSLAKTET